MLNKPSYHYYQGNRCCWNQQNGGLFTVSLNIFIEVMVLYITHIIFDRYQLYLKNFTDSLQCFQWLLLFTKDMVHSIQET